MLEKKLFDRKRLEGPLITEYLEKASQDIDPLDPRGSLTLLHSLFNYANDAIFLMQNYTFIDCNLKTETMFGCPKSEIIGRSPIAFSTKYQYDGVVSMIKGKEMLAMAKKGAPQFFAWRHCRKDGTPFDTEVSLNSFELSGKNYIQAIVRDVTENKRAREEILREREKLQTLSDNAPFGMVLIDEKGNFSYINARFTELLGYDLADIPNGRKWFEKAYPDPGARHKAVAAWIEDFRDGTAGIRPPRTFAVTCKDGTAKTLSLTTSGLTSGNYLMTCEDITEIKRLESQLHQAQKMESLGTLAGGIVHDFNNLLTALMGYASLIKLKIDKDEHLNPYVDQIFTTSQKAAELTKGLLAFSRRQPVKLAPTDINTAIKSTEKLLRKLLAEDIELQTTFTNDATVVMADRSQIDQIFFNLATNAKDAMSKGGLLSIATDIVVMDSRFIEAHGFGSPGAYVVISVSDTGHGMDETTRDRIFDPFFTTKEIGTGIGLSTVYGILKQHNGFITVYSEPGRGTTFRIYLPSTDNQINEKHDSVIPIAKGEEKILIAEDDHEVRGTMQDIIRQYGYKTIEATDGDDAIEKFKQNPDVDLVILDSIMPKKNGCEVYEEISRLYPDVRVLFTSGYTKDVILHKGIEESNLNFLAKPLLFDQLLQKIREILDR